MNNIEIICHFHFCVEGFLGNFGVSYIPEGDEDTIGEIYASSESGRTILGKILPKVKTMASRFDIEVNEETVSHSHPYSRKEVNMVELHVGRPAEEFNQRYVVSFISGILRNKMGFKTNEPSFFVYYLPNLPAVITNKGVEEFRTGGFYNPKHKRIEINIHPSLSCSDIYENMVHEIFHHVMSSESSIVHNETIVDLFVDSYSDSSRSKFEREKTSIFESIEDVIRKQNVTFKHFNSALDEIGEDMQKCPSFTANCRRFQDAVTLGTVRCVPISGENMDDYAILRRKKHI